MYVVFDTYIYSIYIAFIAETFFLLFYRDNLVFYDKNSLKINKAVALLYHGMDKKIRHF